MVEPLRPVVRFAPSPTGLLHVGNMRPAVLNYLFAMKHQGTFILRLDDTDRERSTEAYADAIRRDLAWLGFTWPREYRQSDRTALYDAAAARLKAAGRLYPCYEAEDELDRRRKLQLAQGRPPIYDRASLDLTDADRARLEAEGRRPYWRFKLANAPAGKPRATTPTPVVWPDLIRGEATVDAGSLSDPVLIRADGSYLYTFTSVVDDIDLAITHVIRGEDHVTNTGVQIQIFEALGGRIPAFAHHSLLVGADGAALSKRLGALGIGNLRDTGVEPLTVVCHAALVGTSDAIEAYPDMAALAQVLDLSHVSRAPGRFDPEDLKALNARVLQGRGFDAVKDRLAAMGIEGGEAFWLAVKGNITVLGDCAGWWQVVNGSIAPVIDRESSESRAVLAAALDLLPPEPWGPQTWSAWTAAVKAKTGAKGRALFHPLRLALTGRDQGPELAVLLPLIGRPRASRRLSGETG